MMERNKQKEEVSGEDNLSKDVRWESTLKFFLKSYLKHFELFHLQNLHKFPYHFHHSILYEDQNILPVLNETVIQV